MDLLQLLRWCRVSSSERPRYNALQMQPEVIQCNVSHLDLETLGTCMVRLMKCDVTSQRGFDSAALVVPNVVFDEGFKFFVRNGPDFQRNTLIRTAVQLCASIIGIERIDAETIDRESHRFPAAGRTGNYDHFRTH